MAKRVVTHMQATDARHTMFDQHEAQRAYFYESAIEVYNTTDVFFTQLSESEWSACSVSLVGAYTL